MSSMPAREPMPDVVAQALDDAGLRGAYGARPPCQRNDPLFWINAAKRNDAKQ